ncbi:VOC family protein [Maribacter sp. ACAM166]|uniref:VOC family protein n=1 Tax=Maribacter sp. ACAM166 TaxID=2508996 RepID=UPI002016F0F4|nr:VOC family protein [Maribacter sp. ACAM166]
MIGWFEVPVIKMERAKKFYETILDISITRNEFRGFKMGRFPDNNNPKETSGCLVQHEDYKPSLTEGTLIYFSCENVADVLTKVAKAGGQILQQKTEIGEGHGFMGLLKGYGRQ